MDVLGNINASGFTIDGEDISEKFSWNRSGSVIYFNEDDAVVGIGTDSPTSNIIYDGESYDIVLDVRGTMNVSEILIDQIPILSYMSSVFAWQDAQDDGDIYFDTSTGGSVGIGVSEDITEILEVSGGIKIGYSIQEVPEAGTIEYDSIANDFYGYIDDGVYSSLTGVQYDSSSSRGNYEIPYWSGTTELSSTSNFVFMDDMLAIGTDNPTAMLTIQGDAHRITFLFMIPLEIMS